MGAMTYRTAAHRVPAGRAAPARPAHAARR
nr:MAG TPA: hypothetical protein [Caudoviricetes sp.]